MRGIAVEDALERLAETRSALALERNLVVEAFVLESLLALEDRADDRDVLLRARERLAVGDAMPALDDLRTRRPEPEDEAAAFESA